MLGNWAIGKPVIVTAPTITVTIAITMATIGRLMKNLDITQLPAAEAVADVTLTGMPSLTFCTPSTTTRSPGLRPSSIIHMSPLRSPTLTVRTLTLSSLPTTATWVHALELRDCFLRYQQRRWPDVADEAH